MKQPDTNTRDMAEGLLERYRNYTGDSFYNELASMLNGVNAKVNITKSTGNIKLEVLNADQKIIDYTWTYVDENGNDGGKKKRHTQLRKRAS